MMKNPLGLEICDLYGDDRLLESALCYGHHGQRRKKMKYKDTLNDIVLAAHDNALDKGFYDDINALTGFLEKQEKPALASTARRSFVLEQMAKVGGEVGEAVDVVQRTGVYGEEFEDELADVIIRVADLAGYLGIDLGRAVQQKMRRNRERPRKHGKVC